MQDNWEREGRKTFQSCTKFQAAHRMVALQLQIYNSVMTNLQNEGFKGFFHSILEENVVCLFFFPMLVAY